MPPRSYWTGRLRLSLVSIPVRLYSATDSSRSIALHQIHKPSGKRIRYQKVAPGVGEVEAEDIVKGYEYSKGHHVLLEDEDLESIKVEAKDTIELVRFVDPRSVDPRYYDKPYYVLPDGKGATEGYAVIREALREAKRMGIGQVVMRGKPYVVGLRPCGKGILLETLRHKHELRAADGYFDEIKDEKTDPEALDLAKELIDRKAGDFDPADFPDTYTDALRELIEAKREDRAPEAVDEGEEPANVVNIMDALRKSLKDGKGGGGKTTARKTSSSSKSSSSSSSASRKKKSA